MEGRGIGPVTRTGSFRKRPLEARKSDGTEALPPKHSERSHSDADSDMELSCSPSKQTPLASFSNGQHILDEVEEHFQRSLRKMRSSSSSNSRRMLPPSNKQTHTQTQTHVPKPPTSSPLVAQEPSRTHTRPQPSSLPQSKPQFKTILPKPLLSETHEIVITENSHHSVVTTPASTAVANSLANQPALVSASSAGAVPTTSCVPTQFGRLATTQPIVVTPAQFSAAGPVTVAPAPATQVVPGMVHGMQLINVSRQQPLPTIFSVTSPQSMAAMGSLGGVVSGTQVPSVYSLSNGASKGPIMAVPTATFTSLGSMGGGLGKSDVLRSPVKREPQRATPSSPQLPSSATPSTHQPPPITTMATLHQPQQQLMTVINPSLTGQSPIFLLPGSTGVPLTVPSQPYILVNPSDLSLQQQQHSPAATSPRSMAPSALVGTALPGLLGGSAGLSSIIPNPSMPGSYIVLQATPGTTFPSSVAGTATVVGLPGVQPTEQQVTAMVTSPVPTSPARPAAGSTLLPRTRASSFASTNPGSNMPARSSLEGHAAELIAPASVEDHFAKALGDQTWSSLKNYQPQPVVTAQRSTVAS